MNDRYYAAYVYDKNAERMRSYVRQGMWRTKKAAYRYMATHPEQCPMGILHAHPAFLRDVLSTSDLFDIMNGITWGLDFQQEEQTA